MLHVILSLLGLRIGGSGGSGARNWRIPGGGVTNTHRVGSRANITAPTPGLRKTRTAKIVKCPEKASKVLETPQGSRFCSKIRRFRPGISNAWHAFEICAPGIAGRGPATLFFARPGAAHLADFAPGDTRGGPQCRGNARKRPPKPPIWRKKCYKRPQNRKNDLLRPVLLAFGTIQTQSG